MHASYILLTHFEYSENSGDAVAVLGRVFSTT